MQPRVTEVVGLRSVDGMEGEEGELPNLSGLSSPTYRKEKKDVKDKVYKAALDEDPPPGRGLDPAGANTRQRDEEELEAQQELQRTKGKKPMTNEQLKRQFAREDTSQLDPQKQMQRVEREMQREDKAAKHEADMFRVQNRGARNNERFPAGSPLPPWSTEPARLPDGSTPEPKGDTQPAVQP